LIGLTEAVLFLIYFDISFLDIPFSVHTFQLLRTVFYTELLPLFVSDRTKKVDTINFFGMKLQLIFYFFKSQ
jgi:hypothetical protein